MQIDFHLAVIYVLARTAGFSNDDANVIARSSQYVDDNTQCNPVKFSTGGIYNSICSAHKALDYRNFQELADHLVWTSFHFLPGNCMLPSNEEKDNDFVSRLVCKPNSYVARDMINECIRNSRSGTELYRLGITLHVYADTWAHQGFAGIQSNVNRVQYITNDIESENLLEKVSHYFSEIFDRDCSNFIDDVLPLGHGAVLSYPDRPFLKWSYKDSNGNLIHRDNPEEYKDAVRNIYFLLRRFRLRDAEAEVEEMDWEELEKITQLFKAFDDEDGVVRNQRWLQKIKEGFFSFGPEEIDCFTDGYTWGQMALSDLTDCTNQDFLNSHWKKFQDALIDHHYFLLRNLFPKYGLCIA